MNQLQLCSSALGIKTENDPNATSDPPEMLRAPVIELELLQKLFQTDMFCFHRYLSVHFQSSALEMEGTQRQSTCMVPKNSVFLATFLLE